MSLENNLWKVKQMLLKCRTKASKTVLAEGPPHCRMASGSPEG